MFNDDDQQQPSLHTIPLDIWISEIGKYCDVATRLNFFSTCREITSATKVERKLAAAEKALDTSHYSNPKILSQALITCQDIRANTAIEPYLRHAAWKLYMKAYQTHIRALRDLESIIVCFEYLHDELLQQLAEYQCKPTLQKCQDVALALDTFCKSAVSFHVLTRPDDGEFKSAATCIHELSDALNAITMPDCQAFQDALKRYTLAQRTLAADGLNEVTLRAEEVFDMALSLFENDPNASNLSFFYLSTRKLRFSSFKNEQRFIESRIARIGELLGQLYRTSLPELAEINKAHLIGILTTICASDPVSRDLSYYCKLMGIDEDSNTLRP